ncbi:MAG: alcohol dehydrogenase [Phycisphaerales bacterium]|nr:MAG: alcohol dehydrogenase [Phycisphaerales bacterium]
MNTCFAAVMPGPHRPVELRELPLPELEQESALLRVICSEVCGTDVHLREGQLAGVPYPIIPGHVTVGVLERIRGRLVDVDGEAFHEGDVVTFLDVHGTCHQCRACLIDKASTRCPNRKVYGITYGVEDGLTGGWSQYVYLKPGTRCIALGDVTPELFLAGGCSMPTTLHAVERADVSIGDTVLVLGAGPVGLSCVAFSLLRGAGAVLCTGAPRHRLDVARAIGAADCLDITGVTEIERRAWVMDRTRGRGADVTIEATGVAAAVVQAMRWTRDAGRVVVVGQYTDAGEVPFNPHTDLNRKHLDVRGCWGSDYSHFHRSVRLLDSRIARAMWSQFTLSRYELKDANQALGDVATGKTVKALILPPPAG